MAPRPPSQPPRPSALANRRFRWLVLLLAGVPLAANYAWWTAVGPLLLRPSFGDEDFVFAAAAAIRSGSDPYAWIAGGYTYGKAVYIYPPLWAWLQQPLVSLGGEGAALALLAVLQLGLALFLLLLYRALRPIDPQEVVLGALLTISFVPVFANLWSDQVNLVVLAFSGVLLAAYVRGDRWWGGAAYGVAMALKPLQPGVGLVLVWGRRGRMLIAALAAALLASLLPGPRLVYAYLTRVFGAAAGATGFRDNAAPAGLLERLLHPATFYTGGASADLVLRVLYGVAVLAVLGVTWWALGRRPRERPPGRALEVAVAVAASPLLLSIAHTFHLVLLLLPILVLLHAGFARSDRLALAAALAGWLLVGPVHSAMLSVISSGFSNDLVLRVWNESQLVGVIVIWLGCVHGLRQSGSELDRHPVPGGFHLDPGRLGEARR